MYLHEDLEKGYFTSDRKNTFMTDPLKTHNCDWLWIEIDCKVGMYLNILKSQPGKFIHHIMIWCPPPPLTPISAFLARCIELMQGFSVIPSPPCTPVLHRDRSSAHKSWSPCTEKIHQDALWLLTCSPLCNGQIDPEKDSSATQAKLCIITRIGLLVHQVWIGEKYRIGESIAWYLYSWLIFNMLQATLCSQADEVHQSW